MGISSFISRLHWSNKRRDRWYRWDPRNRRISRVKSIQIVDIQFIELVDLNYRHKIAWYPTFTAAYPHKRVINWPKSSTEIPIDIVIPQKHRHESRDFLSGDTYESMSFIQKYLPGNVAGCNLGSSLVSTQAQLRSAAHGGDEPRHRSTSDGLKRPRFGLGELSSHKDIRKRAGKMIIYPLVN